MPSRSELTPSAGPLGEDMTVPRTVLFVCRHGAAKSVLAASDFRRRADERGLGIRAASAGVEPDPAVSPAVAELLDDRDPVGLGRHPRKVTRDDLTTAWRVITFDLDPADLPIQPAQAERWDGLPSISEDVSRARDAIGLRIDRLIEDCLAPPPERPRSTRCP